MNTKNLSTEAIAQMEPVVEEALTLKAAAAFKVKISEIKMEASANAAGQGDVISFANQAQAALNEAEGYTMQASALLDQAREIAHRHGSSLPGMPGLRAISDNYTRRIAAI